MKEQHKEEEKGLDRAAQYFPPYIVGTTFSNCSLLHCIRRNMPVKKIALGGGRGMFVCRRRFSQTQQEQAALTLCSMHYTYTRCTGRCVSRKYSQTRWEVGGGFHCLLLLLCPHPDLLGKHHSPYCLIHFLGFFSEKILRGDS